MNVKCKIRSLGTETNINTFTKWRDSEVELNAKFCHSKDSIHNALCGRLKINCTLLNLPNYYKLNYMYPVLLTRINNIESTFCYRQY